MGLAARIKGSLAQERRRAEWGARYYLRHAEVGRRPIVIGRPLIENRQLAVGDELLLWSKGGRTTFLLGGGRLQLGDRVFVNSGVTIDSAELVEIGDDVALAYDAYVSDTQRHGLEGQPPSSAPVRIGAGCWIGLRATIMPGVTLGRRCVVAAHTVVTSSFPDDALIAGVPGRLVRTLDYPQGVIRAWTD